ncbi:MAG: SufD family Fe-S cluster assembly protein [Candidatus Falkowbacteria bacterium]|nr:SufD family Fe-S cluster assembly protein [Candidatus Falkowbacteria bacterium]
MKQHLKNKIVIANDTETEHIFYISKDDKDDYLVDRVIEVKDRGLVTFYYCFMGQGDFEASCVYNICSGARVNTHFIYFGRDTQKINILEKFNFNGANSVGEFSSDGLALNSSQVNIESKIIINQGCDNNSAALELKLHLLSQGSIGSVLPALEIKSDKAVTSHSAKIFNYSKEDLNYLESRGIGEESANKLLQFGIINTLAEKIKNEEIKSNILKSIL